jgi:hypothetical protein
MWAIIGLIHLVIMSYQDIFKKRLVDDRHNYFMFGSTVMLLTVYHRSLWYILTLFIIVLCLNLFLKKTKAIGEADISSFNWLIFGFGYIGTDVLIFFVLTIIVLSILFFVFDKLFFKLKVPSPFIPVLAISFIINISIFKLWI